MTIPSLAQAEDVEKRWRLSVALGGYNPLDEVQSNAANELTLIDRVQFNQGVREAVDFYRDPRDDNATFGALDVRSGTLGTIAVQYALTKMFMVEASIGYHVADVGDIEVSVEFANDPPPIEEVDFNFSTFNLNVGEFTRIPIQLDGIFRFRPRAKFNPYVGIGIGYAVIGFDPSQDLNALSLNIDRNIGTECQLSSSFSANPSMPCGGPVRSLNGISIEAGDSFEWNAVVGGEVTFKRKMAIFVDLRYIDASRQITVHVDQGEELGVSVPQLVDFNDSIAGVTARSGGYGAVQIGTPNETDIGLIDGGYRVLVPNNTNPQADCSFPGPDPSCVSQFLQSPGSGFLIQNFKGEVYEDTDPGDGDGRLDPGKYYVQGGSFAWDGLSLQVGFRYTF